jgi:CubicO group peptidase (beta-lactamase class C family)
MKKKYLLLPGLCFLCIGLFCLSLWLLPSQDRYIYRIPEKLNDDWEVSSLSEQGMDEALIVEATNQIINDRFKGIHSMVIVKNGHLVHEAYFKDYTRESLHRIHSITKSISSMLIGITIDKSFIKNVEEPVYKYFPEYDSNFDSPSKRRIKIKHILTLTSGIDWAERQYPYSDPRNNEYHQVRSDDWIGYVLEQTMRDEPGTKWEYNTGSVHLLSGIIKQSTGQFADKFAEKYLFKPLGIRKYEWNRDPSGYPCTGGTHGGLRMRTRDVAKIGSVILNGGKWKKQQIVSKDWVTISTDLQIDPPDFNAMGYLWWRQSFVIRGKKIQCIYGAGYGGQSLTLVPVLDLIIVFTCWTQRKDAMIFGPMLMAINSSLKTAVENK